MSTQKIENAIPHRKPMLLVDEIVTQTEKEIHCRKTFQSSEFFFQGHYPDFPIVPGVILCEAAMQAGAILISDNIKGDGSSVPVLTKLTDARFRRMVRPGETVDLYAEIDSIVSRALFLNARVECDGAVAVRFSFACTLAPKQT
jgi:3-hydroxyacyl-[acyl-carrier-protein] dehydratase